MSVPRMVNSVKSPVYLHLFSLLCFVSPIPARWQKTSSNHDEWYREILKSSMRLTQRQSGQLQINNIQYDVLPTFPSNLPP